MIFLYPIPFIETSYDIVPLHGGKYLATRPKIDTPLFICYRNCLKQSFILHEPTSTMIPNKQILFCTV